jgi:hypothetical protein
MKNQNKIIKELDNLQDKLINYRGWKSAEEVDEFIVKQVDKIKKLINNEKQNETNKNRKDELKCITM